MIGLVSILFAGSSGHHLFTNKKVPVALWSDLKAVKRARIVCIARVVRLWIALEESDFFVVR